MRKNLIPVLLLFIVSSVTEAQNEFKVISKDTYDAGALYGYMNGGSELYLEYGFQSLTVEEIDIGGETITCEAYTMPDNETAYGIFSVNVYKCGECFVSESNKCCNPYQLQAFVGNQYLSIINSSGSEKAQKACQAIYEQRIKEGEPNVYQLPEIIESLKPKNSFVVSGLLAIENRVAYWSKFYKVYHPGLCHIINWGSSDISALVFRSDKEGEWNLLEEGCVYQSKYKDGLVFVFRANDTQKEVLDKLMKQL